MWTNQVLDGKRESMEIRPLGKETYAGKTFTARYRTGGYYDIRPSETGFQMDYVPFAEPTERSFDDVFSANGSKTRSLSARLRVRS